jgi:hypothetical protein
VVALAVLGDHWDVLRAVVDCDGADVNEGFSVAVVLCDEAMMRFLRGRGGECVWSQALESTIRRVGGEGVLSGVQLALRRGWATREFVEGCLRVVDSEVVLARLRSDALMVVLLLKLDLRIGGLVEDGEMVDINKLEVMRILLNGDLRRADVDLPMIVTPDLVPDVIRDGAPVRWATYGDGEACLPVLTRFCPLNERLVTRIATELRRAGVDVSRHHYCAGRQRCRCGYAVPWVFATLLAAEGAVPCTRLARFRTEATRARAHQGGAEDGVDQSDALTGLRGIGRVRGGFAVDAV